MSFLQGTGGELSCSCCESKAEPVLAGGSGVCAGSHFISQPQRVPMLPQLPGRSCCCQG